MKNLQVELSADNLTANYSFETYEEIVFNVPQTINYLDRSAYVAVTNMSYSGKEAETHSEKLYQCNGVDYSFPIYNKRITYELDWTWSGDSWIKPRLRAHMDAIAQAMGLSLNWIGADNYQVPCNEPLIVENAGTTYERRYEKHTGTVGELIDRLVGWSRDIPSMLISCRIWGQALNVVQRGHENFNLDLDTNGKIARKPLFSARQIFTAWDDTSGYIYSSDNSLTKEPFTGTISFGGHTLNYENGYLTSETHLKDETDVTAGSVTTTYTYGDVILSPTEETTENAKYLLTKTVTDTDENSSVTATYEYFQTANEVYLGTETETHYIAGVVDSKIVTTHAPLGNGWFGTTVYDKTDGSEILSTSLGQGAPGGKVSQYMVDVQQEGLTNNADIENRRASIAGIARMRATYPIYDIATLRDIAREINKLNKKTEITVNVDVYGITEAIDTDTTVTFDGSLWYVVSNSIEITPMHKLQRVTLIRWE